MKVEAVTYSKPHIFLPVASDSTRASRPTKPPALTTAISAAKLFTVPPSGGRAFDARICQNPEIHRRHAAVAVGFVHDLCELPNQRDPISPGAAGHGRDEGLEPRDGVGALRCRRDTARSMALAPRLEQRR